MTSRSHLIREKLLFQYTNALQRGDFDTVATILRLAESDPTLDTMLQDLDTALLEETAHASGMSVNGTGIDVLGDRSSQPAQSKESQTTMTQATYRHTQSWIPNKKRRTSPLAWFSPTMAAVTVVIVAFAALLIFQPIGGDFDTGGAQPAGILLRETGTPLPESQMLLTQFKQYIQLVWNDDDPDAVDQLLVENHTLRFYLDDTGEMTMTTRQGLSGVLTGLRRSISDADSGAYIIEEAYVNNRMVIAELSLNGVPIDVATLFEEDTLVIYTTLASTTKGQIINILSGGAVKLVLTPTMAVEDTLSTAGLSTMTPTAIAVAMPSADTRSNAVGATPVPIQMVMISDQTVVWRGPHIPADDSNTPESAMIGTVGPGTDLTVLSLLIVETPVIENPSEERTSGPYSQNQIGDIWYMVDSERLLGAVGYIWAGDIQANDAGTELSDGNAYATPVTSKFIPLRQIVTVGLDAGWPQEGMVWYAPYKTAPEDMDNVLAIMFDGMVFEVLAKVTVNAASDLPETWYKVKILQNGEIGYIPEDNIVLH